MLRLICHCFISFYSPATPSKKKKTAEKKKPVKGYAYETVSEDDEPEEVDEDEEDEEAVAYVYI